MIFDIVNSIVSVIPVVMTQTVWTCAEIYTVKLWPWLNIYTSSTTGIIAPYIRSPIFTFYTSNMPQFTLLIHQSISMSIKSTWARCQRHCKFNWRHMQRASVDTLWGRDAWLFSRITFRENCAWSKFNLHTYILFLWICMNCHRL